MAPAKMKRYQNITTMNMSVMKEGAQGPQCVTLRPNQIIHLTGKDVEMSKDAHQNPDDNPFDKGWISEIPAGESRHPDSPDVSRNPKTAKFRSVFGEGTEVEVKAVVEKIKDIRGITFAHRALEDVRERLGNKKADQISSLIDSRGDSIQSDLAGFKDKFGIGNGD